MIINLRISNTFSPTTQCPHAQSHTSLCICQSHCCTYHHSHHTLTTAHIINHTLSRLFPFHTPHDTSNNHTFTHIYVLRPAHRRHVYSIPRRPSANHVESPCPLLQTSCTMRIAPHDHATLCLWTSCTHCALLSRAVRLLLAPDEIEVAHIN